MRQQSLQLKQQEFIWTAYYFLNSGQKEPIIVSDIEAYTEQQALFLGSLKSKIRYDKNSSFAKKIGVAH